MKTRPEKNVLGDPLETCSLSPLTGFMRDGDCRIPSQDAGVHGVCAVVTEDFLEFTKARGNDLSTPQPSYGFPGLKPGDRWCLCAGRWKEADAHGVAPPVDLAATHEGVLNTVSLNRLRRHAVRDAG
jgi:hypothetical protein